MRQNPENHQVMLCFYYLLLLDIEDHNICLMKGSLERHYQINSTHSVAYCI